ncbi:TIGR01777 family oxidoreductase [Planomicrobium sp. CPCC 101110]|uniref:TIGR01777 family oxidoreductase n=1 Tax=Planomicrobium sp. CPCC 101110 TaxID=2599619 RepID=UPI0011B6F70D|nr:TIGR01777 family oxidoreductase [Planomicrobium sp. CPCC 101110]TWT25330.1 TIGR01777 family protein [Planomicrobium sp. CPCC 101110]
MERKVVIAGGTGFIGRYFEKRFMEEGYDVYIVSRQEKHLSWLDHTGIVAALDGAEMLINSAGKSVNCRYNKRNKEEILESRIETTQILGNAMYACENAPPLWINSSSATIYRHAKDRPMTESNGEIGTGFSAEVAKAWEQSLFAFKLPRTRQVALRTAIVLGEDGGVMTPYLNLVRFGLGGMQGSGDQMFSWIHIEDLYRIVLFLQEQPQLNGIFNCSAPHPVSNRMLMSELRKQANRPMGFRAPAWMLEMGAAMIRTETELVLKSRWVLPERLQKEGFEFRYDTIDKALAHIMH